MNIFRAQSSISRSISRVSKLLLYYSTEAPARGSKSVPFRASLSSRVWKAGGGDEVSVVKILDDWVVEGNDVNQSELRALVKKLRNGRRSKHALQVSAWMTESRIWKLSPGDVAVHVDLISKVHGLEEAEKYFDEIPQPLRTSYVYGALLSCYVRHRSVEKAESTMQKIKESGETMVLYYNLMLKLYSKSGSSEKLDTLMQEIIEKGMEWNIFTYNMRLNSYVAASDIEGMEKLLMKMEADPHVVMTCNPYIIVATGYLKSGLIEKASRMLKKVEQHIINGKGRKSALEILISMYGSMGNKDEVYRIWKLCKRMGVLTNSSYRTMLTELVKLDDISGVESIMEEWEYRKTHFDHRIPNILINAYCRKGLLEKAEAYVSRLVEIGKTPGASTWDCLAQGYRMENRLEEAVESIKKAKFPQEH